MPTANPLEQLRRRMLSHASPAAFAAAAEEHRRAGRFAEAIAVCRDGLARYPTYASARVTLGKALLDSGDLTGAVAELEQAVAQAPDNLAASRTLDAAHAQLAALPPPVPDPAPTDVTLRTAAPLSDDTGASGAPSLSPSAVTFELPDLPGSVEALHTGPDSPQEFGLGPDWMPTAPNAAADAVVAAPFDAAPLGTWDIAPPAGESAFEAVALGSDGAPLQGEEPAGVWAMPEPGQPGDGPAGPPVYSWAFDADVAAADTPAPASVWDAPTLEAPLQDVQGPEVDAPAEPVVAAAPDGSADPGGTGAWSGLFVEPVSDGATPVTFSGWEATGATAPDPPVWAAAPEAEPVTSAFTVPGLWGTASADGVQDIAEDAVATLPPASTIPDWSMPPVDPSDAAPEAMGEWTLLGAPVLDQPDASAWLTPPAVDPAASQDPAAEWTAAPPCAEPDATPLVVTVPGTTPALADDRPGALEGPAAPAPSLWSGSVASALEEVFARAGQEEHTPASLEPPAPACEQVRDAMAAVAVEATREDVAGRSDSLPPALVSLQQMLDAVRARRASLHAGTRH